MKIDKYEYPGGLEIRLLLTPLVRTIIRAAVVLAILGLIYCLLR